MLRQTVFNASRAIARLSWRSISVTTPMRQSIKNHVPNNLEKRFLVWTGKYKEIAEVPSHISQDTMERCRNKIRIRLANIMILLTIIGCCVMVYSGKQAAKRGETVSQMNLDWHKRYNEEKDREAAAAKAAAK